MTLKSTQDQTEVCVFYRCIFAHVPTNTARQDASEIYKIPWEISEGKFTKFSKV